MSFSIQGLNHLMRRLEQATNGELKEQFGLWLEAMGMEFLDLIQDEIIRTETVDTRRLLNSFDKGNGQNVWQLSHGGLTLEVGTNVEYAQAVNDGHWTTPNGVAQRFVPGHWSGSRFNYDPSANTGMVLRRRFVQGKHYWDSALAIFDKMFEKSLEKKLQQWLDTF